jgi:hypothetical protein
MVVFFAFAGLLAFWVLVIALVKFERGDVGVSPAALASIRLRVAMDDMTRAIGESLLPVFRALTQGIVKATEMLLLLDLPRVERGDESRYPTCKRCEEAARRDG